MADGKAIEGRNITINGGIVSATGDGGIQNGTAGKTILGYTNSGDRITATNYLLGQTGGIKVKDGQYMITDNNVIIYGGLNENKRNAIAGHTLRPYTPTGWSGSGTAHSPYIIDSVDDLILLSLRTNGGTHPYSDTCFKLGANINFNATTDWDDDNSSENNFTAIAGFEGHFDGDGYTISGLRIFANDNYHDQNGLFTNLGSNAYIENLTISNARIAGQTQVGAIAGYVNSGATITNCHVTGTVAVHAWGHTLENHGGIVGANYGTVSNCVSEATITRSCIANDYGKTGGIVGTNHGTLSGNKVFNANLTVAENYGAIAGLNDGGTLANNYYRACTVNGTANTVNIGVNGADITTGDGALSLHTISTPNTVTIVTTPTLTYNTVNYWAQGKSITLSGGLDDTPTAGWQKAYSINDVVISENSTTIKDNFNMPATDVTITIGEIHADWANTPNNPTAGSSSDNPYKIYFTDQLDLLATRVNNDYTNTGYAGKYFKLMNNLEYDTTVQNNYIAIGNWNHQFKGCFDGNNDTISGIRINKSGSDTSTDGYQGIFGHIQKSSNQTPSCEVKNLTIDDADITAYDYAGGIVGYLYDGTVTNCHATSTVFVRSTSTSVSRHGGIVGSATAYSYTSEISHCTSSATLTSTNANGSGYGAIAGTVAKYNNISLTVSDNLAIGATVPSAYDNKHGAIVGENYQNNSTLERNYYHNCTVAGEVNTVTKGCQNANVTQSDGAIPVFTVSVPEGVTASATPTVTHNSVNYYKESVPITLTGGLTGETTPGCQKAYVVYGDTLIGSNLAPGHVFDMQNANAVVTVVEVPADWAAEEGAGDTEENPYKIYYTEQLDLLATRVNAGESYSGKYFKLMDNLTYDNTKQNNYTAIGNYNHQFKGCFDGNYKTISGIRINKDGNSANTDGYQGIFGSIRNGDSQVPPCEVKNLTIDDADITANSYAGGIVGFFYGGTVTNCHATSTVFNRAVAAGANSHGGIVGEASAYNTAAEISHCTSSATLTNTSVGVTEYGAIVGAIRSGVTMSDNFAIEATVPSCANNDHGAIVGYNNGATLARNYYHNCTVAGIANVTDKGCANANVDANDGAMPVFTLSVATGITAEAEVTFTRDAVDYYKLGTTVSLSYVTQPAPGYEHIYSVYGSSIDGDSFNMVADANVTVVPDLLIDWATKYTGDDEDHAYLISNVEQWNMFANRVNGTNGETATSYSDKFFKLMEDISVTNMVGASSNKFSGTFDGNGHTLTFNQDSGEQYIAPFRYINSATIQNLKVAGTVTSSNKFAGGVVAHATGSNTIAHCVNSTIINATINDNGSHGGILGQLGGSNNSVTISGCVFNGKMLGDETYYWCGIIGYSSNSNNSITINNCFFNPEEINVNAAKNNYTICRSGSTINNCYYNTEAAEMSQKQGKLAHSITGANEFISIEIDGVASSETTIGVIGYNPGIKYDGVHYAASGETVSLLLNYTEPGYDASQYYANGTKINLNPSFNSYPLNMPNANVVITADVILTTIYRQIEGYGDGTDKWAFIASPVEGSIDPTEVSGLIADPATDYDLYRLNPTNTIWENYKEHEGNAAPNFTLKNGRGYLYATKTTKTLAFSGTFNTGTSMDVTGLPAGFNLVGNPFTVDAYVSKPYYTLNSDGSAIVAKDSNEDQKIPPCYGVIVKVNENETVRFNTTGEFSAGPNNGGLNVALTQANTRSNTLLDNAIVSFNEDSQLGKFYFGTQNANIYIPQYGEEYAIASSDKHGEMPLNFKAVSDGTYTLTVNPENIEMAYLHLIDNLTGNDVDLLVNPSYTFTGHTYEYASRFKLVFITTDAQLGSENSDDFAFISNGQLIVLGITDNSVLQVIDLTGRVLSSPKASNRINIDGLSAGVYVLRLINGENLKTQKIVVK